MRTWAALALAVTLAASLHAVAVALTAVVDAGVSVDAGGTLVTAVEPGGFGWDSGIREGMHVASLTTADGPGGWSADVLELGRVVGVAGREAMLRASVVLAGTGVGLAIIGLLLVRRPRGASLLAAAACGCAAVPELLAYGRGIGRLVVLAAAVAPSLWLLAWGPSGRRAALAVLVAGALLAGAWVAAPGAAPALATPLAVALDLWLAGSFTALAVVGAGVTPGRVRGWARTVGPLDVAVLAGALLLVAALAGSGVGAPIAAAAVALPLLALAGTRRRIARLADQVLLADVREREAIRATEAERARLAGELHDGPLQRLAGVVRELDGPVGDTRGVRDSLREVASSIRGVASELRPPVLDDLGLVPALGAGLRELPAGPAGPAGFVAPAVELAVDSAGYQATDRPPAEVELAAYRIVLEAVANAVRHAAATQITVTGAAGPHRVAILVEDDGRGIDADAAHAAAAGGHMGIPTMRRRAELIGGSLEIRSRPGGGTVVALEWHP